MIFTALAFIAGIFFVWLGIKLLKSDSVYKGAIAIILGIILFIIASPGMLLVGSFLLRALGVIP